MVKYIYAWSIGCVNNSKGGLTMKLNLEKGIISNEEVNNLLNAAKSSFIRTGKGENGNPVGEMVIAICDQDVLVEIVIEMGLFAMFQDEEFVGYSHFALRSCHEV